MSLRTTLSDLFNDRASFRIIQRRRLFFVASGIALAISALSFGTRGLNLGIDFEGGTSFEAPVEGKSPSTSDVREVLADHGEANAKLTLVGGDSVRVQVKTTKQAEVAEIRAALARYGGVELEQVKQKSVGPTFGAEVTEKAIRALVVFLLAVTLYLAVRFEWKMALSAVTALVHDLALTVGVYSLTGFEVTPGTVIAILTILGYSLYDTVVVFDKVRENAATIGTTGRHTYAEVVNRSVNQTLMRSLNTSLATLIPVASLLVVGGYVLGALAIRDFSLALFVGLLSGTYSSIFVASPVLAIWKEREPRYRALRQRVEARAGMVREAVSVGAPRGGDEEPGEGAESESDLERAERAARARPSTSSLAPRGRQQRRRKRKR
ncbi:MAG: protein translocase subunit SecF [Actinobacteria bacterium]|nr:protein translocase subunit SecF [Actinomycetota bacterium]